MSGPTARDFDSLRCPSCGAPLGVTNPGIVQAMCAFCLTLVYWDEEAVRSVGQRSRLGEGFTRLWTGAVLDLRSRPTHVLGRVRYEHRAGFWDEWWAEQHGRNLWIVEDDHEVAVEEEVEAPPELDAATARLLSPGALAVVAGARLRVRERGRATCSGVEGQLPGVIFPGSSFDFVDLSSLDGRYSLNVEIPADGPVRVFRGEWVHDAQIHLQAG